MVLVAGSMRASVPLLSVIIQMLPPPATIEPSELPIVMGMVAATAPVFRSSREIVLSPQFGTHRLPNAAARPEQGRLPTGTVAATVFEVGLNRATLSLGLLEIHTSSSTAIQSGEPGTGNTASGFNRSIGILTPGVLTPGLGAGGAWAAADPSRSAMTIVTMLSVHNSAP